ncbi:MAG: hypothetical protein ACXWNQ_08965 [Anaerolineales bacterium]
MRRDARSWILKNKPLLTVALIFFLAAVYFYQDPEWNGNSRLELTRAIVEQGSLQIDAYHSLSEWYTEDVAYFQGHYYCDKAVGSSLFAVPLYFVLHGISTLFGLQLRSGLIKHVLTSGVLAPIFTMNGVVMYLIAGKLGANPRLALITTLAVGLGTMLWPYSAVYYGHVMAATFLIIAFYLLLLVRDGPQVMNGWKFAGAGAAMGFAFITEYTAALIIVGLLFYAAYVLKGRDVRAILRLGVAGAMGALLPLLMMFAYNYGAFGNPLDLGYAHEASDTFQKGMSAGIMGLQLPSISVLLHITVDPKFGLLWLSPVLILAPIGYLITLKQRSHRAEAVVSVYAVTVMLVMNAGYYLWWGGYAFGPRLIIPSLSFFIIPLALLPGMLDLPMIVLTALSIGQMLIPLMSEVQMSVDFKPKFNTFFVAGSRFTGFSILYQHGLPSIWKRFRDGDASWTLGSAIGIPYWLTVPMLILLGSLLIYMHAKSTTAQPETMAQISEPADPDVSLP